MKIAINGAGIAGPTLAYWLRKAGHEVLLIEQAPKLRTGGYVIDFWGVGYDIAEKMNLIPQLKESGYQVKDVRIVDENGRTCGGFSADVFGRVTGGRFTSLLRSDLAAAIYSALDGGVEAVFGDSIAGIEESAGKVWVSFDHTAGREVDLVIGADGLHSRVRRLAFGPQERFEVPLGYHVAAFQIKGYRPRDELVYVSHGIPGRQISRLSLRDDWTLFLMVFRDEHLSDIRPHNDRERKSALRKIFAGVGWESPQILEALGEVDDLYFDRASQIRMDSWTKNRTALIGDAAACVSLLAGEGSGLAMAEAYVLAGELSRCGGDYRTAFTRYQELMMQFLLEKQRAAEKFASTFAPATSFGIAFRNFASTLLRIPVVADLALRRNLLHDIKIPDYDI